MYYNTRNHKTIAELAPHTRSAALKLYEYGIKIGVDILIYDARRTIEEQRRNVLNKVSWTMKSYHLCGQALDFVPVKKGKADWNGYSDPLVIKWVEYAIRLGFEWGGSWKGAVDKPHLQFEYLGYGTDETSSAATKPVTKPVVTQKPVTVKPQPKPVKPKPVITSPVSLVDWMKSHKMKSGFTDRALLAKKYGIVRYAGTAEQNTKLLKLLQKSI